MKLKPLVLTLIVSFFAFLPLSIQAASVDYNFIKATPIGSWQVREETATNHKGKQHLTTIKTALVGKETRDGETHYWIEMDMQNYKIKKEKRKKTGDRTIIKILVPKSTLSGNYSNVIKNLRSFGKEIIIQSGNKDPMLITGGGILADNMLKIMGTEIKYNFQAIGTENITVPAGKFKAKKIAGTGSTEMKIIFKTIKVDSKSKMWISNKMPFGLIKSESNNSINGKPETILAKVITYGSSGATTQITKTPTAAPEIPKMPNIFGKGQ